MFSHIQKCLKIHQLNIIKITKKDYKKRFVKDTKVLQKRKKEKKRWHGQQRNKNHPEDDRQRLLKYRKKYYKMRENASL